jgi:hypothetical protein
MPARPDVAVEPAVADGFSVDEDLAALTFHIHSQVGATGLGRAVGRVSAYADERAGSSENSSQKQRRHATHAGATSALRERKAEKRLCR